MRFSLKWLLFATAFLALAAAAMASRSDLLASAVWWLTLSAVGYAMLRVLNLSTYAAESLGGRRG